MADNGNKKGGPDENLEGSEGGSGSLQGAPGAATPGISPAEGAGGGASPDSPGFDPLLFRQEILQAIASESDTQVKIALIEFLNKEGDRDQQVATAEVTAGREVRLAELEGTKQTLNQQGEELSWASWRTTVTALAPVAFALLVSIFLFLFHKWQMEKAANAFEKILLMVITGGLGWAAGRRSPE